MDETNVGENFVPSLEEKQMGWTSEKNKIEVWRQRCELLEKRLSAHDDLVRAAKATIDQIRKSPTLVTTIDALYDAVSRSEKI